MIAWETIDPAQPGASDEAVLSLHRRGDEWSIRVRGVELMNSRRTGSERALAERAARACRAASAGRVLVGGLGMGHTQAAALACFPRARVTVAEISPRVIAWNHGPLGALAGNPLADPRSVLLAADVAVPIRSAAEGGAPERWDAILLDLDNGPEALSRAGNASLYSPPGIATTVRALAPGGVLGVWSAGRDAAFEKRLRKAGCDVRAHRIASGREGRGGSRFIVWIAQPR